MEAETEQVVGQRQFKARPAPVVGKAPSGEALGRAVWGPAQHMAGPRSASTSQGCGCALARAPARQRRPCAEARGAGLPQRERAGRRLGQEGAGAHQGRREGVPEQGHVREGPHVPPGGLLLPASPLACEQAQARPPPPTRPAVPSRPGTEDRARGREGDEGG